MPKVFRTIGILGPTTHGKKKNAQGMIMAARNDDSPLAIRN